MRSDKGITGIDITISVILITIFIGLISTLTYQIQKNSSDIERKTEATSYAVELLEQIKSEGFEKLPVKGNQKISSLPDGYITDQKGEATGYYRTVTVLDYTDLPGNETKTPELLKKVTVQIMYKSGKNEQTIEMSTIIAKD